MKLETQLNILLKYIQANINCRQNELPNVEALAGVNLELCLRQLKRDGYVVGTWNPPKQRKSEMNLRVADKAHLFIENGGYKTGKSYNIIMLCLTVIGIIVAIVAAIFAAMAL